MSACAAATESSNEEKACVTMSMQSLATNFECLVANHKRLNLGFSIRTDHEGGFNVLSDFDDPGALTLSVTAADMSTLRTAARLDTAARAAFRQLLRIISEYDADFADDADSDFADDTHSECDAASDFADDKNTGALVSSSALVSTMSADEICIHVDEINTHEDHWEIEELYGRSWLSPSGPPPAQVQDPPSPTPAHGNDTSVDAAALTATADPTFMDAAAAVLREVSAAAPGAAFAAAATLEHNATAPSTRAADPGAQVPFGRGLSQRSPDPEGSASDEADSDPDLEPIMLSRYPGITHKDEGAFLASLITVTEQLLLQQSAGATPHELAAAFGISMQASVITTAPCASAAGPGAQVPSERQ